MAEPLYVICGATGHVGTVITRILLEQQKRVRVVARHAEGLKPYVDRGAQVQTGSLEDEKFVRQAFGGAQAAFVLVPPNLQAKELFEYQKRVANNLAQAVDDCRVGHVVSLSSLGANVDGKTGPVRGLRELEQRLNRTGAHVLHLRAAYFMENHLNAIAAIKQLGFLPGALRADLEIPQIATRDIGVVAARRLAALDFSDKVVQELLGPREISMNEVAGVLGEAVGKKGLSYRQLSYAEAIEGMSQMGLPKPVASLYGELAQAINEGRVKPVQPRTPQSTTPTTLEEFAKSTFAPAFQKN